jgi:hypothetical protein
MTMTNLSIKGLLVRSRPYQKAKREYKRRAQGALFYLKKGQMMGSRSQRTDPAGIAQDGQPDAEPGA